MMAYIRQPLKGIPIRYKTIKGKKYAYQRIDAYRDRDTGKVVVKDRHLGAVTPARPKPLMEQLNAEDLKRVTQAWRDGEDMSLIIERIRNYTGDFPAPATVYNSFRAQGITRDRRTTQRAEKRTTTAAMKVERVARIKAEAQERKARQAKARAKARKEIERGKM